MKQKVIISRWNIVLYLAPELGVGEGGGGAVESPGFLLQRFNDIKAKLSHSFAILLSVHQPGRCDYYQECNLKLQKGGEELIRRVCVGDLSMNRWGGGWG